MPWMVQSVWLLMGGVFAGLYFGNAPIAGALWVAPVCLLHVTRHARPLAGLLSVWSVIFVVACVRHRDIVPLDRILYFAIIAIASIVWTIPYAADRLIASRGSGFASTMIFPLAWAALEFAKMRVSPDSSWMSPAYSQCGVLPLLQLTSVTGLPGIIFVVAWFASTVNWMWDHDFAWGAVGSGGLLYSGVLAAVLIAGVVRIARAPTAGPSVRTAAISYPRDHFVRGEVTRIIQARVRDDERRMLRGKTVRLQDWFLESSRREAGAGARIIVWPELNLLVFKEDEADFLVRAQQLAREQHIYLLMGMAAVQLGDPHPLENKAVLLNPAGAVDFSYDKSRLVPGWEETLSRRPGNRILPISDTPYGRVTAAICADGDEPRLMRQAGEQRADLLLLPVNDWAGIKDIHRRMAVFRAVENGVSLFRAASTGVSTAVDPYGRTLATKDDVSPGGQVMVVQLPIARVATVYARAGDLFGWLCVAGLVAAFAISRW